MISAIILILIFIAGLSNAVMDKLQFHFNKSIFSQLNKYFWDPNESWVNKWAKGLIKNEEKLWYYLWLYKPKYKERFPYSSTILVFATDGWHLAQWVMLKSFIISAVLMVPITDVFVYDFIICQTIFSSVFELFYGRIFVKK